VILSALDVGALSVVWFMCVISNVLAVATIFVLSVRYRTF
jgi:hypothetical protein